MVLTTRPFTRKTAVGRIAKSIEGISSPDLTVIDCAFVDSYVPG